MVFYPAYRFFNDGSPLWEFYDPKDGTNLRRNYDGVEAYHTPHSTDGYWWGVIITVRRVIGR